LHIVYVGSYHPRKGTADLERALRRYLPDHPRTRVSFLGTGIAEQDVRSRYSAALHPQIKVVPEFENTNLPALLSDGHVMLLPSVCEGFGVALVEAMACGLAPITTRTQGPAEIVTHEHDGLLVPPRSPQAITSALERVWTHRTLLHDLRRNAHRTAQSYDWPRVARDNLRLYARHASFAEPIASAE
jgi:glycosyltransferase involved in cell wall biosynthesis